MQKNEEKAKLYDQYVYHGSRVEGEISKLKAENIPNIPANIQEQIDKKKIELEYWDKKLKELYT